MTKQLSLLDQINNPKNGYYCSCCGSYVKEYTRSFNSNMSIALLFLYRLETREFIHLENEMIKAGYKRCGDASYLVHFGFIERMNIKRADGSNKNGMYRITSQGIFFAENKTTAPAKFKILNNKFKGFEGEQINIIQALGEKFEYSKLMQS